MNTKYVYDEEQMKKCWKQFISGQKITGRVRPEILSAWERCRKLKTDPYKKAPKRLTDEKVIAEKLAKNETLLTFSKPAIEYLYRFLQDAHLFAAVSDADGYLLAVYGDTSAIDPDHNILYTCWSEARLGNNPIGTSLYKGSPTQTFGYEHYCIFPHHFSGAGAPIHDPKGRIIGGISITHVADSPHPHTLAMIVMTAYAIERSLRQEEAHQRTLAAYSHLQIVLDSISDGILVLGQDHQITMVNQSLCKFLHVSQDLFVRHPIDEFVRDKKLLDAISNASVFDDYVTDLRLGSQVFHCTITSRYTQNDDYQDQILIINDYNRIQKLASKLTDTQTKHTFENMVIGNSVFRKTADIAHSIALNDSNVLLLGESGTGKDVLAQAIHNGSSRASGPFIPINCGAIQKELVTSEDVYKRQQLLMANTFGFFPMIYGSLV